MIMIISESSDLSHDDSAQWYVFGSYQFATGLSKMKNLHLVMKMALLQILLSLTRLLFFPFDDPLSYDSYIFSINNLLFDLRVDGIVIF